MTSTTSKLLGDAGSGAFPWPSSSCGLPNVSRRAASAALTLALSFASLARSSLPLAFARSRTAVTWRAASALSLASATAFALATASISTSASALAFALAFASALAFVWWYEGIARLGVARAMVFTYLTPVIAVAVAVLLLGEELTLARLLGAAVVITGVRLARRG